MSDAQKKAAARYRAKQTQIQALINPETEPELFDAWEYLVRQFDGSKKKALSWAILRARSSLERFRVWKDGEEADALIVAGINMNGALDQAAHEFGYVDYADMAAALGWSGDDGLNIVALDQADDGLVVFSGEQDFDDECPIAASMRAPE
ncbi:MULTISPECIES: hypothetical protein [unclassified Pseudomonas]|uniref:hypothetical protein n=1 Tax=unclassified Pseudomonas TaxID=196821 RepID=UPI00244B9038|nr:MULTISPECIES: hypothetical protein [unclassified Pseudomonas]MDG9928553.1 hypothetical protein [Pseudomonas sp. GD04042]MDH0482723.1 hypothetical protein [Pseudomonas sp. GD04015]MDH0604575.1 hypothetical protein [Pseudomonas sp. GD03869]